MRRLRRTIEMGLPVLGVVVVLAGVLFFARSLYVQLIVVLLGLLLIQAGIWKLANPVLPSERRYNALRAEVDAFILLVRRLNRATLQNTSDPTPANRARLLQIRDEMMESVHRMEAVAGRTEGELAAGPRPSAADAPLPPAS
ncbi:MAG TPA: hypothetical protein VF039_10320 [Longimicrobiales bacterium]